MRGALLKLCTAVMLAAQQPIPIGVFEEQSDVGNPAVKGSATFDPEKKEYRVTGAGANIWARSDEFHFVWKRLAGNGKFTATLQFVGTSEAGHRKAGLMIRKSLEAGSPYVDAVVHGDGLTSLQFREAPDDITREFRFPVAAPERIQLEKKGNSYSLWYGKPGAPLQEAGSVQLAMGGGPLYVGLFISSHDAKTSETAVFSDVALDSTPAAAANNARSSP